MSDLLPVLTKSAVAVLEQLKGAADQDAPFLDCTEHHGATLSSLQKKDFIVHSKGLDGDVKYRITGRGINALSNYTPAPWEKNGKKSRSKAFGKAISKPAAPSQSLMVRNTEAEKASRNQPVNDTCADCIHKRVLDLVKASIPEVAALAELLEQQDAVLNQLKKRGSDE